MAGTNTDETPTMERALKNAIREHIAGIVKEEGDAAAQRVKDRVNAEVDGIAASLFKHYSVERMGDRIVIEVVKPFDGKAES